MTRLKKKRRRRVKVSAVVESCVVAWACGAVYEPGFILSSLDLSRDHSHRTLVVFVQPDALLLQYNCVVVSELELGSLKFNTF